MARGSPVALGILLAAVVATAVAMPPLDAEALAVRVREAGVLGSAAVLALLVLQCVVAPIPSEPIMMATGYVYGPRLAFALSWAGVVAGAAACFVLARTWGRPLAERVVRADRLDAAEAHLQDRGAWSLFAVVLAVRAVAFQGFDVLSYACGIVRLPLAVFLAATAIGAVPKVLAFTYAGATFAARPAWLDALLLGGTLGVVVVALAGALLARRGARGGAGRLRG